MSMSKQNNQQQKTSQRTTKAKRMRRLDWDKPDPSLQYNIFKGFGNPFPHTIRGDGEK